MPDWPLLMQYFYIYKIFLVLGLFVDVGENISFMEQIDLSFIYDDVGIENMTTEELDEAVSYTNSK